MIPPFTRRRIAALAAALVRDAGVEGVLPTPMEAVRRAAGIRTLLDVDELAAEPPPGFGRVLGAYWYERAPRSSRAPSPSRGAASRRPTR